MTEDEFSTEIESWEQRYLIQQGWLTGPNSVAAFQMHARDITDFVVDLRKMGGLPASDLVRISVQMADGEAEATFPLCLLEEVKEQ